MKTLRKLLLTATLLLVANASFADRPFQLALTPEIALVPRGDTVRGVALNIWGENEVRGLTVGLVNGHVGDSLGFTYSVFGTYAESYRGVIWGGLLTHTTGEVVGWQSAVVNISRGDFTGLQTGFLNWGQDVKGVQLGFVNYSHRLNGVQLGIVNVVATNEWFTNFPRELAMVFPIVNWSF